MGREDEKGGEGVRERLWVEGGRWAPLGKFQEAATIVYGVLTAASGPGEDEARRMGALAHPVALFSCPLLPTSAAAPLGRSAGSFSLRSDAEAQRGRRVARLMVWLWPWLELQHPGPRITLRMPPCGSHNGPAAAAWGGQSPLLSSPRGRSPSTLTVCSLASSPAALWATQV